MNIQPAHLETESRLKLWMKRFSWALPLFFLVKGLLWLAIPFVSALYVLD